MKFALSKEHRYFFQEKGFIEFDSFITPEQLRSLNAALESQSKGETAEQLFLQGRDLWRHDETIKKWATLLRFAEILSELMGKHPVRLGYDQLLPSPPSQFFEGTYKEYLQNSTTLESMSCIRGVLGGVLIALSSLEGPEKPAEASDPFPNKAGSVTFLGATSKVDWTLLSKHPGQRFYFIVFTEGPAWYILQPGDPHTHKWKNLGYVFNDKLRDNLFPVVYW